MEVGAKMSDLEMIITIFIVAGVTFFLRVCPFLLFKGENKLPEFVEYLGEVLPYAVMGMLVVYCFKSVNILHKPYGFGELIAATMVVVVHKKWHNMLYSIVSGTGVYMLLLYLLN